MKVNINLIQYYAIVGSILLIVLVIYLVRNRKISERYSLIWIISVLIFLFFSIWRDSLDFLSVVIGIAYPPMALILILIMMVFLILIQYSIILTKLSKQNTKLIQELSLLTREYEDLKSFINEKLNIKK